MGVIGRIKGIYSEKATIENTIKDQERRFKKFELKEGKGDHHLILALTFLYRRFPGKIFPYYREMLLEEALERTIEVACIPPPLCARALGIITVLSENDHLITKYPELTIELEYLIKPVEHASNNGELKDLYYQLNPFRGGEFDHLFNEDGELTLGFYEW